MGHGLAFGIGAYVWWGFLPLYLWLVREVAAWEILAHRIVWSFVVMLAIITVWGRWERVLAIVRSPRRLGLMALTTLCLMGNWLGYIIAVQTERVVEASLGYFILPIISNAMGVVILKERLRPLQLVSLGVTIAGVAFLTWRMGTVPIIALGLAFAFATYGLLRKMAGTVGALEGLTVETALATPIAAAALLGAVARGGAAFLGEEWWMTPLLMAAGIATAVPLLLFAAAVRRLPLVTMGFLQYLAPSLQFLVGVLVFGEAFGVDRAVTFALIWTGLGIFTYDSARHGRRSRRGAGE